MFILQLFIIVLPSLLIYSLSVRLTTDKLDGSHEASRLGAGIAKVIIGLMGYGISGVDRYLLELWQDVEGGLSWIYYLVRLGMLVVAVVGIIQCALAIFQKCEKLSNHTHKELEDAKEKSAYAKTPTWKRIQEED